MLSLLVKGRVIVVPPRGKKVSEGVDMQAFYKQML